ncbi:MAG: VTC domain-containing protein, partial [Lawsonibacter sp.]
ITFDDAIRFRTEELSLDSDPWGTDLLSPDQVLMELKAPGAIPLWMVHLLTEMRLYKTSFSRYGTAYQILLEQEWKGEKRYA